MRAVELAKVAASAEALRLRRMARRTALHGAFYAVAGVFGIAAFVVLHVVLYQLLALGLGPFWASVALLVLDLAIAGVFVYFALRDSPDGIEEEARVIRQQALAEMRRSLTPAALAAQVAAMFLRRRFRRRPEVILVGKRGTRHVVGELAARLLARR